MYESHHIIMTCAMRKHRSQGFPVHLRSACDWNGDDLPSNRPYSSLMRMARQRNPVVMLGKAGMAGVPVPACYAAYSMCAPRDHAMLRREARRTGR